MNQAEVWRPVISHWKARAAAQELKPGQVRYQRAALEYFIGASTALMTAGVIKDLPIALALLATGRPVDQCFPSEWC